MIHPGQHPHASATMDPGHPRPQGSYPGQDPYLHITTGLPPMHNPAMVKQEQLKPEVGSGYPGAGLDDSREEDSRSEGEGDYTSSSDQSTPSKLAEKTSPGSIGRK